MAATKLFLNPFIACSLDCIHNRIIASRYDFQKVVIICKHYAIFIINCSERVNLLRLVLWGICVNATRCQYQFNLIKYLSNYFISEKSKILLVNFLINSPRSEPALLLHQHIFTGYLFQFKFRRSDARKSFLTIPNTISNFLALKSCNLPLTKTL